MTMSQNDAILELLRDHGDDGVTPIDALQIIGTFRLAARIHDLKALGYDIRTESLSLSNGKKVARYVLRPREVFHPTTGDQIGWIR